MPFLLLLSAVFLSAIGTQLVQDGMFNDGLLYVSVAKNLAQGKGTFWNPYFSETLYPSFHQQPPLLFLMEAQFFKLFGDSMYVERFYCLVIALTTGMLMVMIWKMIHAEEEIKNLYWYPLILLMAIPITAWAYSNNVIECTMGIFVLLSVFFLIKALKQGTVYPYILLAGIMIFLSSMCKGVQGTFTIGSVFFYWFAFRKITFLESVKYSLVLLAVLFAIYGLLLLDDTALHSFRDYYSARLENTFNNPSAATTASRFHIIAKLALLLAPITAFSTGLIFFSKKYFRPNEQHSQNRGYAKWFLLIAISGSFPMMVTLEQRTFYLTTSLSFYALALSSLTASHLNRLLSRWNPYSKSFRTFKRLAVIIFTAAVISNVFLFGRIKRDKILLTDIHSFGKIIPGKSVVKVPPSLWHNWCLHGYFMRYFEISLYSGEEFRQFLVMENNESGLSGYRLVKKGKKLVLYEYDR